MGRSTAAAEAEREAVSRAEQSIGRAAAILRDGGTVAFPTETVYGLGADARNTEAVEAIFKAKGRPSDNPLIVHIADASQLGGLVTEVSDTARRLMAAFWPGPLTLVLPLRPGVLSPRVTAGLTTVGIRMPDHPIALKLIGESGCPVAAPSANRSGRPSPTLASHVEEDLSGLIDGILDGGPTGVGLESTVVQVQEDGSVTVLRPGGITSEQLAAASGVAVTTDPGIERSPDEEEIAAPKSPGMKYTHYAPKGALTIVQGGTPEQVSDWIDEQLKAAAARGERTGVMAFEEHIGRYAADCVQSLGSLAGLEAAAHRLYAALRRMDEEGVTFILSEACPEEGLGAAIMNRLRKAAGQRIVRL
ncbi:L-threonylcarbamoyladenylate synthase [Paenibacillus sp. OAE614]|uniref:L-threonylcarbamoyladenylate synthase n=1 Tax=Paenibacillus sp. OAE614 TaxID=2663804 RepID=UPI0033948D76